MIEAILNYTFMQNAVYAAVFGSIICGIIGTIIVEKKLVSMSGGIAHTSFGGIGLGYLLNIEPIIGGLVFAIFASLGISIINKKTYTNSDTIIGMFWSVGMALGIFFIALTPGYPPDMTSYLFGDILTVSSLYIVIMIVLSIIIIATIFSLFDYWKLYLFDQEYSKVLEIKSELFEYILMILIGLSIVILTKVVGIILAIAMLTMPPAISKLFLNNLKKIMISSIIIGIMFSMIGLYISYQYGIPSGATIIIVSVIGYFCGIIVKKMSGKVIA